MAIGIPKQIKAFRKKTQEATYLVTDLLPLKGSHTVDENIVMLIYETIVSKMLGQDTV